MQFEPFPPCNKLHWKTILFRFAQTLGLITAMITHTLELQTNHSLIGKFVYFTLIKVQLTVLLILVII